LRAAGRLRPEIEDTLANYCCTAAELRVLSAEIAENGSVYEGPHGRCPSAEHSAAVRLRSALVSIAKCLGMTPDSAARLEAGKAPSDDPSRGVAAYARSRTQPRAADDAAPLPPGGRNVLDFVRAPRPPADPAAD
jgi:phage terminase small subunit